MSKNLIRTGLPSDARLKEGLTARPTFNHDAAVDGDIEETRAVNSKVAAWFDAGVRATGNASVIAARAGVSDQFVSAVRQGKKALSPKLLVAVLEDDDGVIGFCAAVCEDHGLAPPRRKRKVTRREVERMIARKAQQLGLAFDALAAEAARELGADVEDIRSAINDSDSEVITIDQ